MLERGLLLTGELKMLKKEGEAKPERIIKIDCLGETCPVPLVETRKAIRRATPGEIIEVRGDHPSSKREIPMAVKALGLELLSVEENGSLWVIKIRIPQEEEEG